MGAVSILILTGGIKAGFDLLPFGGFCFLKIQGF